MKKLVDKAGRYCLEYLHVYNTRAVCVCKASAVSYSHLASWIHPTESPFSVPSMVSSQSR